MVLSVFTSATWADPATQPKANTDFTKGAESFSLYTAFQNERTGEDIYFAQIVAGWGKYAIDNGAIEFQAVGYYGHDEEDSVGIGGNILGRYHFLNFGRWSVYGDILGGLFVMTDDFPTGGTAFNFTYAGGPGITYRIRDGLYFDGGMRFQHVSNGFIEGRDRNPICNSIGGYIGLTWLLD